VAACEEWLAPEGDKIPQTGSARATLIFFQRELASEESPAHSPVFYRSCVDGRLSMLFWRSEGRDDAPTQIVRDPREGSILTVTEEREASSEESSSAVADSDAQLFVRVHLIGTIDGELHVAVETWKVPPLAHSILG